MWNQFLLENIHFAINIFGTLAFFCIFWLHLDAWKDRKSVRGIFSIIAFLLLSISFLFDATTLESTILVSSLFGLNTLHLLSVVFRNSGYILLIIWILVNPISQRPGKGSHAMLPLLGQAVALQPILCATVAYLYIRRATLGLENHLKRIGLGFFILSLAEFLNLFSFLRTSPNVMLFQLSAPFGPIWIAQQVLLFLSFLIFARWGFYYLFKRFESQLFIIFTSIVLVIFLVTTVSFTSVLLKNIEVSTLSSLQNNAQILLFSLESKKAETLSDTQVLSQDPSMQTMMNAENKKDLRDLVQNFLISKKTATLLVLDNSAVVLARGEDRDRVGDSLSSDPLVKRALLGQSVTSIVTKEGVLAPEVHIVAVSPIKNADSQIIGAVMSENIVDNAFLDALKDATNFEVGIYAGDSLSATSVKPFTNSNDRAVGIKETDQMVKNEVLGKGNTYSGTTDFLSVPYLSSFVPLKDADNSVVGMLFVGSPQIILLQAASHSIELTFVVTIVLLVASIIPSYLVASFISKQI